MEDPLRRRDAYSKEEFEAYLEDTYEEEFTILSRTEVYDSYTHGMTQVEYEVQYDKDTGLVFTAYDRIDSGFSGWHVVTDLDNENGNINTNEPSQ